MLRRRHDQLQLLGRHVGRRGLELHRHSRLSAAVPGDFVPAAGVTSTFGGAINNNGSVTQNGPGTTILSGANTYSGSTTISNGVLQANIGAGIPSASFLSLDGGVLQSNGTRVTFTRAWARRAARSNGRPTAAVSPPAPRPMNVRQQSAAARAYLGNHGRQSNRGNAQVRLPDGRQRDDVPERHRSQRRRPHDPSRRQSQFDRRLRRRCPGTITGSGGIIKTGGGLLKLTGTNTYTGTTTIGGGVLQATIGTGIPSASFLSLDGGVLQSNSTSPSPAASDTQRRDFQWTANGGGFSAGGGALTVNVGGDGATR